MSQQEIEGIQAKLRWKHLPEHTRVELELRLKALTLHTNTTSSDESSNE